MTPRDYTSFVGNLSAADAFTTLYFAESPGMNCIKIGLPGKSVLGDYFQENRTSRRPFLLLRISFPGRPIFIQLPPDNDGGPAKGDSGGGGGNLLIGARNIM